MVGTINDLPSFPFLPFLSFLVEEIHISFEYTYRSKAMSIYITTTKEIFRKWSRVYLPDYYFIIILLIIILLLLIIIGVKLFLIL